MRSRYRVLETDRAHFVTSTVIKWLPVFNRATCCDIMVESLEYCRRNLGMKIYAWVIMPDHFHGIFYSPDLPAAISALKKFTARALFQQCEREGRSWICERLIQERVSWKSGNNFQLWQEGYHPQSIYDDAMMLQKMEYLHHNPVRAGFVAAPERWRYSSAHEWEEGAAPVMRCDEWRV